LTIAAVTLGIFAFIAFLAAIYFIRGWFFQDPQEEVNELER